MDYDMNEVVDEDEDLQDNNYKIVPPPLQPMKHKSQMNHIPFPNEALLEKLSH